MAQHASLTRIDTPSEPTEDAVGRLEAFADLTYLALTDREIPSLLEEATARLCEILEVELSDLFELQPDGRLLLRAEVGWGKEAFETLVPIFAARSRRLQLSHGSKGDSCTHLWDERTRER